MNTTAETSLLPSLLRSLYIMSEMVEARDPYTGGHLWRVSQLSKLLAEKSALNEKQAARISLCGFLHDLGKVAIPDAILLKPGKLTHEEYNVMKNHPDIGVSLLHQHSLAHLAVDAIRGHHERADGQGYPLGISISQLDISARIVAICDAFDAMTSIRPYRQCLTINQSLSIIEVGVGKQFDAHFAQIFLSIKTDALAHIVGHTENGVPLADCRVCGPVIKIPRTLETGSHAYCQNCASEYVFHGDRRNPVLEPTGGKSTPVQLSPKLDYALIDELTQEATPILFCACPVADFPTNNNSSNNKFHLLRKIINRIAGQTNKRL